MWINNHDDPKGLKVKMRVEVDGVYAGNPATILEMNVKEDGDEEALLQFDRQEGFFVTQWFEVERLTVIK